MIPWGNSEFWNSEPFPKINCVLCFSKLKTRKSKYQSCAKFPWTRSGKFWTQTKFIWHGFGAVWPWDQAFWHWHLGDATTPCPLPKTARSPYTKDKAMSGEQILHSDLAQIREDLRPIGVRTWVEATVPRVRPWLTRLVHARSHARARSPVHGRPCTAPCL
jgi:hypothetical protein